MKEYIEKQHIYADINNSETQEVIAEILSYTTKHMIEFMTKLAMYYYETDKVIDYGKYGEKDHREEDDIPAKHLEYLYTLIQDEGKDILLHIGTGEFTPEVFTRKDIPQFEGFSHSPLPLFVIPIWAKKQYEREQKENTYRHKVVRKFLDEHAIIYAPKWWQAQWRDIGKPWILAIDFGMSNGIIKSRDAMLALQDAIIHKQLRWDHDIHKERFIRDLHSLQGYSKKEFLKKSDPAHQRYASEEEKKIFKMLEDIATQDIDTSDEHTEGGEREDVLAYKMYDCLKMLEIKEHPHHQ